jgi:hypothetical protein
MNDDAVNLDKFDQALECAPGGGQSQAAFLTVCRA